MHPVMRHDIAAMGAAGLRDLVFVVREDQVEATAVNVELLAEIGRRHGRALDVPTGAAANGHCCAPVGETRVPAGLICL